MNDRVELCANDIIFIRTWFERMKAEFDVSYSWHKGNNKEIKEIKATLEEMHKDIQEIKNHQQGYKLF